MRWTLIWGLIAVGGIGGDGTAPATARQRVLSNVQQSAKPQTEGYDDTPFLPDGKWRVHDRSRPHPPIVDPGPAPAKPVPTPADAIVLFDGKDPSKWEVAGRPAVLWKVQDGYFEITPKTSSMQTKDKFGDLELHIEWAAPAEVKGSGQGRGNSGLMIMGLYEIQILDSYNDVTYADGQAASIYGQFPPKVNACRKPGEWQTFDVVFEAPRFDKDKLVKPAFVTVVHNGIKVHDRQEIIGAVAHKLVGKLSPHEAELPIMLQDHGNPVRFRNIWLRRIAQTK